MTEGDPPVSKDFFISYNQADREWAEWIAWQLEEFGYSAVIQAWDFRTGSNFAIEIDRAIRKCKRVIAVLSPAYLTSKFTQPEWAAYFADDPTGEKRSLIPIRVRECEPKGLLMQIAYVDVFGKSEDDAKTELFSAIELQRLKPKSRSHFPGSKPNFPSVLPEIWNVPHLRNPNFTEPGQQLAVLRDALSSGKPTALTQALAGLGGIGKTQLATEYAYRYMADYTIVWWLHAEQLAALAGEYAALAKKLDLPEADAVDQSTVIAAVRNALQRQPNWLLVFDNANKPEEIRSYLPSIGGHVLITSRNPVWSGLSHTLLLEEWESEVAVEFLLKRTGESDAQAADRLAHDLGFLPLALEQAAAYIDSAQTTFSAYRALFRDRRLELLEASKPGTDYSETVRTTWDISFRRLEKESPGGALLLQLCAFFAPDNIPRDIIAQGAQDLPAPLNEIAGNPLAFDEAVSAIRRYSLINVGGESILSMHRLVQAVIRDRLDLPSRKRWVEAVIELINKAFPHKSGDAQAWKECDRLLAHAMATMELADSLGVAVETSRRLLNQMGMYALGRADYGKARSAFEKALAMDEEGSGPDQLTIATIVNNIGLAFKEVGDFCRAEAAFRWALQIGESVLGPDHPDVATFVNNLGSTLTDMKDFEGARIAVERALKINEKVFGPNHEAVAMNVSNLGQVLIGTGDLPGGKAAFQRALEIDEKVFGDEHPEVATDMSNLAKVMQALGDSHGAKAYFERAIQIREATLGRDHPHLAIILGNLGSLLSDLGDLAGAKACFERAVKIDEMAGDPNNWHVAIRLHNLADVLLRMGDSATAKNLVERAAKITETTRGHDHPDMAHILGTLGAILRSLGDSSAAQTVLMEAIKVLEGTLGPHHTRTRALQAQLRSLG